MCDGLMASHVIDDNLRWNALAFLRGRGVEKTPVHILAIEHERRVSPNCFIVVLVVLIEDLASVPVAHDELLENDGFHHRNIGFPFSEPLCALNRERQVVVKSKSERRTRDLPLAAQEIEAPTSTSKSLRSKTSTTTSRKLIRPTAHCCKVQKRTYMAGASERNSSGEPTDATTDNGDLELLESRGRVGGGREVSRIHESAN